ncbi:MAG: beta-lactamase family protein [Deltaproteobacteria bacterium]|nr:MAG: beta-lactamase family protein [Deltaproteobacteria bacterium]
MKIAAAVLAGVLTIAGARAARAEPPPRGIAELRARVARVLLREHVPGAGIALVDGDRVVWAGGVGVADRATGRPVTADTLFRVGSVTKSFLALVKLAERGRVDLDAPVSRIAPELAIGNRWAAEQPITLAHLLEHTAGFDDMHFNEMYAPLAAEAMPLGEVLAKNPASRVARWRPGSRFSYANPGYTVAAYVLEKVTGRAYEEVLDRELLRPLGMTGAALRLTPEVDARLARGYRDEGAAVPYRAIYHRPAGNLMASPRDTVGVDAGDASYGLGNYGDVTERAPVRGHDGGVDGFLSSYGYLPGQGVGFVVLLNSTYSWTAVVAIRHLLVEYLLADQPVSPPPRQPVPEDELQRWAGTYHLAAPRLQLLAFLERALPGVEVFVDHGRMYAATVPRRGAPVELIPLGGDRFRVPSASGSHVAFGRDRDGRRVICFWLLASGLALPLTLLSRRAGPSPGIGWPLGVSLSLFAVPRLFLAAAEAGVLGERNAYTVGIFVLTLVFALGSMASAVQALLWLPRPGSLLGKLYRLAFACAACCATAYLTAYGIIGIRLWSY